MYLFTAYFSLLSYDIVFFLVCCVLLVHAAPAIVCSRAMLWPHGYAEAGSRRCETSRNDRLQKLC